MVPGQQVIGKNGLASYAGGSSLQYPVRDVLILTGEIDASLALQTAFAQLAG
jgi:hypothetical protein